MRFTRHVNADEICHHNNSHTYGWNQVSNDPKSAKVEIVLNLMGTPKCVVDERSCYVAFEVVVDISGLEPSNRGAFISLRLLPISVQNRSSD